MIEITDVTLNLFIMDMEEDIDRIDNGLLVLESNSNDPNIINTIMRAAHNLKGSSSMVGFEQMREITHAMENVMVEIKNSKLKVTRTVISLLFKCLDRIKVLKEEFINGEVKTGVSDLVEQLKNVNQLVTNEEEAVKTSEEMLANKVDKTIPKAAGTNQDQGKLAESVRSVKVRTKTIENMINQISDLTILQTQLRYQIKALMIKHEEKIQLKESLEMIETIGKNIKRLQDELMQLKAIPLEAVLKKFPRMVRDLEMSLNKKIEIIIETGGTMLDQNIAEEITNPLVHIVRNSADHGIEFPEERIKAGKPEKGTIKLNAWQRSGQIIITVEDDGRGIDEEKVLNSAIEKGLVKPEDAERLAKHDIINLIFHPGFSTARQVSEISGRGVGMDVVKNAIEKISGTLEIETEKGKGTKITLRIPSTMSVIPSILTEINGKILCIPSVNVNAVLSISLDKIISTSAKELVVINDTVLDLIRPHYKFGGEPKKHGNMYYIVIVGLAQKRVAILIDRLLGSQKIIVKPLGNYLGKIENIMGTTILENGRIGFVLDVPELIANNYTI